MATHDEPVIQITQDMIQAAVDELDGWENDFDSKEDAVIRIIRKALSLSPEVHFREANYSKDR